MTDYIYIVHPLSQNRFAAEVRQPDGSQWSKDNKWWLGRDYKTTKGAEDAITEHLHGRRAFLLANPPYVFPRVAHERDIAATLRAEYGDVLDVWEPVVYEYDPPARLVRDIRSQIENYPGDSVIEPGDPLDRSV
jgi:hypothetical protein